MSGPTQMTVHHDTDGRYTARVPKHLADAMDLACETLDWSVVSAKALVATTDDSGSTTVHKDARGYYTVGIPKAIGDAMDLAGAETAWTIETSNSLRVTKL